jgi:hypothetical protein
MSKITELPTWMRLPPQGETEARAPWRVTAHAFSLTVALIASWFTVMLIAERFGREAYLAVEQQDFSGLGAARADFVFFLICLPAFGLVVYGTIRVAIAAAQWLMAASRR